MKKISPFILLLLMTGVAAGLPLFSVETDNNGVVQRPFNFWSTVANLDAAYSNAVAQVAPPTVGAAQINLVNNSAAAGVLGTNGGNHTIGTNIPAAQITEVGFITNSLEYRIGTNASGIFINGSGVASGVLDGSTYSNFDYNMGHVPANASIHIGAGTFFSLGNAGWGPKNGQRFLGAGMDVTVLKFPANINSITNNVQNRFTMIAPATQTASNIWVGDLTVDCNYTPGQTNTLQAVSLWGAGNVIENIRATGLCSFTLDPAVYSECFGISIQAPVGNQDPVYSRGNRIENCRIDGFTTDHANLSAINFISAASGIIRGNTINENGLTNHICGIGPGNYDTTIEDNVFNNVDSCIHSDTWLGITNCTIVNNMAKGATLFVDWEGAGTNSCSYKKVVIANNIVTLTNLVGTKAFLYLTPNSTNSEFIVTGNIVKDITMPPILLGNDFLNICNSQGLIAMNNTVDALLTNYLGTGNSNVLIHNFDTFGNYSHGNTAIPTVFNNSSSAPSFTQIGSLTNTPFIWSSNSFPATMYQSYYDYNTNLQGR
jgi:hypothetical protein